MNAQGPTADVEPLPKGTIETLFIVHGMTCAGCVNRVRTALEGVSGVTSADVVLANGLVRVRHEAGEIEPARLWAAVRQAGYDPRSPDESAQQLGPAIPAPRASRGLIWPASVGFLAAISLAAFYFAIVAIAQDPRHALELILGDWYFVAAIALGFGFQVALFVRLRQCRASRSSASTAVTGASTGTSSLAMVACCLHHASDLLPLIGLSGAALFLNDNRLYFMLLGIAGNVAGILIMLRLLRKNEVASSKVV